MPDKEIAFTESPERQALRTSVAAFAEKYGEDYWLQCAHDGRKTDELWADAGRQGYLGVAIPEEYGGGGGGIGDLAAVAEELQAAGCPLLLMVVSPAICGSIIAQFGTTEQKDRWLPGFADGTRKMGFAITEADAGSNSHNIRTTAVRDESSGEWILKGGKVFISGVDEVSDVLVVARTAHNKTGKLRPALFVIPTDSQGFSFTKIDIGIVGPEKQFVVHLDDVRLPEDALVGEADAGIEQLFAGLNPERIMAASSATGMARCAIAKAVAYTKQREVWGAPIATHQAVSHPLAQSYVETELARLMTQRAAALYEAGELMLAGEAANMAKYAAGEAACNAVDRAVQAHGGNGLAEEYGLVHLIGNSRLTRIAPVSREMALNFVAQFGLGLPKSY
ncbi:acyl-CoA dehydrogenase [Flexivirga endophytica]|uniref:Acyl-CoA dehydrogenase n=1 Tax=Flexivirga endophytica TaxID=1849103 RepID=A0A916WT38_9MICO|nr:acyl-CoA dehydrogenase [Flexivirga endophytica]GGB27157.1 acyl-CoA dehydrogenase [Flexivirga endophytica]GHB55654.1 acyl-CoA dehydrogenase [Flexivirga endophytica]